jgi:predicted TIM-barrel fold metal-dependent hydrolase
MDHDPTLPIKLDSTSNGEYAPLPVGRTVAHAKKLAAERIVAHARRTGQGRRAFLTGLCGAATTLLTFNEAFAWRSHRGGFFELPREAAFEPAAAVAAVGGREFIFDIQTHMVEADGAWRRERPQAMSWLAQTPQGRCGETDPVRCFDAPHFIKEVFLDSDTDMAVLSFVPELPERNPLSLREAARVRELVAALGPGRRLLLHAMIVPNAEPLALQLQRMEQAHQTYGIAAWKVYTQWGPKGVGWWLDDPRVGVPFIEQARKLGVKTICIHKGLSFDGHEPRYAACDDVGRVARKYPDVTFIIYHSGIEARRPEGAYDPSRADRGVDSLVKSLLDNGVGPNANVYAELGSTWRLVMRDPTQAAHTLGKLIKYVGPKRVLWGTDSIWYGSPQDQIQAFRAFQISGEFQERYGYPALTPELKADVFGLSAAPIYGVDPAQARRRAEGDPVGHLKAAYRADPQPSFRTYGPRDLAEWRRFRALHGVGPE